MTSSHEAELDIPHLPPAARAVHIVPELATKSLLSMGQLCDSGCEVHFTATDATVTYDTNIVLTGQRSNETKLWHLNLPTPVECLSAIGTAKPADLVAYAHAALFSPAISTLEQALQRGHLRNFPGLNVHTLRRHPPQSYAMIKGHLDQVRKNLRSTKRQQSEETTAAESHRESSPDEHEDELAPLPMPDNKNDYSNFCYAAIMEPTRQIYTDQTGKFIHPSSTGNNYLLILYEYDSNLILAEPMPNRTGASILKAFQTLHKQLVKAGLTPKLQRLDNECSEALKTFLRDERIDFQLAPPGIHRRNAAERAIRTFKNHFIAGLCSTDDNFPLHLWDRLVPQAIITLNLLRTSHTRPTISAWEHYNGPFDYDRTPLAPPGIRVLVHEKPANRGTWAPHAVDAWYIGPALESYRCYKVWIWDTRKERIADTISWFPSNVKMPQASSIDMISAGIQAILSALKNPTTNAPIAATTPTHLEAIDQLMTLLHQCKPEQPKDTALLRVPSREPPTPTEEPNAPLLRVPSRESPTPTEEPNAPLLRVDATVEPTYKERTAPQERRRRRRDRKRLQAITQQLAAVPPSEPSASTESPPTSTNTTTAQMLTPKPTTPSAEASTSTNPTTPPANTSVRTRPQHHHNTRHASRHSKAAALNAIIETETQMWHEALLGTAINPDTGKAAEHAELIRCSEGTEWIASTADEFGRLCRGHGKDMPHGTETLDWIHIKDIPKHIVPTYARIVCAWRPEKLNPRRVRLTVGGDRIIYDGDVSTKTADLSTVKLLLNSVISTPNAKFCTADVKDFYLNTPMEPHQWAYMRIPVSAVPASIIEEYNLTPLIHKGYLYVVIKKGMYGLKQAGKIANDQLTVFLAAYGYRPCPITAGLWKHDTRPISFTLVVDDFGIKYVNQCDVDHLLNALRQHYTISVDWTGTKYCGLSIAWDYTKRTCDISMPGYIERALQRFQHPKPTRPQHAPHAWTKPNYGAKVHYAPPEDTSPALNAADTKRVQEVLGTLLYYARAVDSTMLAAIGSLASQQAHGTEATLKGLTQLLNYCATHPDATIRYTASGMILHVESDASYLSESKARSRAAGYHYLSNTPDPNGETKHNGAINVLSIIMKEIVSSAAEAELAALFYNGKEATALRTALIELGHPQPPTPIQTDNSTATGIANDTVKQKRSKAIDMRFYWIRDRVRQGQFHIYWKKGSMNKADYFSKHHPGSHHQAIRSTYIHDPTQPSNHNYFDCLRDQDSDETSSQHAQCCEGVLMSGYPDISINTNACHATSRAASDTFANATHNISSLPIDTAH